MLAWLSNAEGRIRVLNQLVHGKSGVVWLDNCVRDFGRWHNRECSHHAIWELLANFADKKSTHTRTGTTTKRVSDLETLKAITAFGFALDNIKNLVDKLCTLGVVTLGPVVSYGCYLERS